MPPHTRSVTRELRTISAALKALALGFGRLGPAIAHAIASNGWPAARATPSGRRRPRFTAAFRRALKLQGAYMGTMRGLKPRLRAQVKKIRAAKGIRAAIAAARRMAG